MAFREATTPLKRHFMEHRRIAFWQDWLLWTIMAAPAVLMIAAFSRGVTDAADMLHPSGEFSARLMIGAMVIGPVADLLGAQRAWLRWLLRHRRHIGVAAFAYAVLHLGFYIVDMGNVPDMIAELGAPGIWTGWLALLLMVMPALASNDAAMRVLRRHWKRVQQLAYGVALLTLAHWFFLNYNAGPALVHFAPLILLNCLRLVQSRRQRISV
jgi:methionine sulfoxide reductase heme-binding subunit